jgi:hypothetical protein
MTSESDDPVERLKVHLERHKHREQVFVSTIGLRTLLDRVGAAEKERDELREWKQMRTLHMSNSAAQHQRDMAEAQAHIAHLTEALERRGEILFGQQGD